MAAEAGRGHCKRVMKTAVVFECVCGEVIPQISDEVVEPVSKEGLQECKGKVRGCKTQWVSTVSPCNTIMLIYC